MMSSGQCSLHNPSIFHLGAPERILDCCSSFLNTEGQVSIRTLYIVAGMEKCSVYLVHILM